jgi:hypothetical protein
MPDAGVLRQQRRVAVSELTHEDLMAVLRDRVRRDKFLERVEDMLIRGLDRREPWAICFYLEGLRLLDECATIDGDGRLVYNLDFGNMDGDNVVPLGRKT